MTGIETIDPTALHVLPPLPYAESAPDPAISATTIGFHCGKHHQERIDALTKLVAGMDLAGLSLAKVMGETAGKADKSAIFNSAAQFGSGWAWLVPDAGTVKVM